MVTGCFATFQFPTWTFRYQLRRFATWTLCYLDDSPPGRFATTLDDLPPGRYATWTFRYHLRRFATWTLRYLDISQPGCFAPLDVSIPGRFATSLDVSPPDDKELLTLSQITNFQTGGKTSREVAKCPGIETSKGGNIQVVNRPGSEASRYRIV